MLSALIYMYMYIYIYIYRERERERERESPGLRASSFKFPCNLFGIIPSVDSPSGIILV